VSSMLDPEVQPSQAKEMIRTGKGCLAAFVAAAVLIVGGYLVWDKASTFLSTFGEIPDYPGPGDAKILVDVPGGASLDVIGGILIDKDVVKSRKAWPLRPRHNQCWLIGALDDVRCAELHPMAIGLRAPDARHNVIDPSDGEATVSKVSET